MQAYPPSTIVSLSGQIEHITYLDPQSGFTIAQVKVSTHTRPVTVVGHVVSAVPGAVLRMKGHWVDHPRFGRQFRAIECETRIPATEQGICKYLGSGLIKGVGPAMAKRIVKRFGLKTLDIIEHRSERLTEVDGIGEKRASTIRSAWKAQNEIRNLMLFLQSHGISATYGAKIFKQYGHGAITVIQENPYRLANDIQGIGFITADSIARRIGIAKDAPVRIEAGILYVLEQLADEGHVYYPYEALIDKAQSALQADRESLTVAVAILADEKKIVIEDLNTRFREFTPNHKAVYLSRFHICENYISRRLRMILEVPTQWPDLDTDKALAWVQGQLHLSLARRQKDAIKQALSQKMIAITGGPGTGKTTIIRAIVKIYERLRARVTLAAPTGRAAKRLSQACGRPAKTIHRLLEYSPCQLGFQRNEQKPLSADLVIIDEASMIDILLMYHLIRAVPPRATFILIGDVSQLPSVGPGNILKDILDAGVVPVVILNQIFRQSRTSDIVVNAHRINQGQMPRFRSNHSSAAADFYFIEQADPEKMAHTILALTTERIPKRFGMDPMEDIQVLTPMHRGVVGAVQLNQRLQAALNPQEVFIARGETNLHLHDKVMQIRNNYEKEIFNGDIGRIIDIDAIQKKVSLRFDERMVDYDYSELDELVLAYAVSIHKSQGSEYPAVVIPVTTQHYVMLQRNLIYTALTRARRLAVLVGTRRALAIAVQTAEAGKRFTRLSQRLTRSKP